MSWKDDAYRAFVKWTKVVGENEIVLTPELVERYIEHIKGVFKPKTWMKRLHGLQGALRERLPAGTDLKWLERRVRSEWAASGLSRRGEGPGSGYWNAQRRRRLIIEEWPEAIRTRWRQATQSLPSRHRYAEVGSGEDRPGPGSRWAPATREKAERVVGLMLRAALDRNLPLDISPEAVQAFVDEGNAKDRSLYGLACDLGTVAMVVAVLWPERDWGWLRATTSRLHVFAAREPRSRDLADGTAIPAEVEALGWTLLDEALRAPIAVRMAARYRDGLLLVFLLHHPVRLRNLAEMQIGEHLVAQGDGFALVWSRTKNGAARVDHLADRLVDAMRTYIDRFRPALSTEASTDALWLSGSNETLGAALSPNSITEAIGNRVKRRLGGRIWTHLFRHWGAMMVIDSRPEDAHLVAPLLGHRDGRSARFYITLARTRGAAARLEALVEREYRPRRMRGVRHGLVGHPAAAGFAG